MKKKKTTIEILRIILFTMVVSLHVTSVGLVTTNGLEAYTISWYYATFIRTFVSPAVLCFVAIGGYVCPSNLKIVKTLKRLFLPLVCFLPLLMYVSYFTYGFNKLPLHILEDLFTFKGAYYHLWYIFTYFATILFFSIFQKGLTKENAKKNLIILAIFVILVSINTFSPFFNGFKIFNSIFENVFFTFLIVFSISYLLKQINFKISNQLNIILIIIFNIINYLIILFLNKDSTTTFDLSFLNNTNLINIILAILYCLLFSKSNYSNKIFDKIGSLTYGAYIIHIFYICFCSKILNYVLYFKYKYYYLIDIAYVLLVVICSIITEYLRQLLINYIKQKKERGKGYE